MIFMNLFSLWNAVSKGGEISYTQKSISISYIVYHFLRDTLLFLNWGKCRKRICRTTLDYIEWSSTHVKEDKDRWDIWWKVYCIFTLEVIPHQQDNVSISISWHSMLHCDCCFNPKLFYFKFLFYSNCICMESEYVCALWL